MGHRSENGAVLGWVPTYQKATEEFGREVGSAKGEEVLGSWVGSDRRPSLIPSTALVPHHGGSDRRAGWEGRTSTIPLVW